jgi:hypothetical protein
MSRTLPAAREAFVTAIARDTPGTDLPRLVAVLDALLAWSAARPTLLEFRSDDSRNDVLAFFLAGTKVVFWSATASRGAAPTLELYPPAGRSLTPADRTLAMQTLNAHARGVLAEGDRLRIGFGALKNDAARAAVLELMTQLLANACQTAE